MKKFLYFFFLIPSISFCATTITPPINFGGGVDHSNIQTEVADSRAADCQNMVGDVRGSIGKRNGSERYILQAISTNPIVSQYSATIDQGTTTKKVLIITTNDKILISTGDITPVWKEVKSGLKTPNQNFSFANHKGQIVMTGNALTDPIYSYNIISSSFTELLETDVAVSSEQARIRAKFVLAKDGYLILANVLEVSDLYGNTTSYFGDRMYYSLYNHISSFTYTRWIGIKTGDGESITGMTGKGTNTGSQILFYKPHSITSLTYTNLDLTIYGGDINVAIVADGFGCISPYALVNIGEFDFVPTYNGIILYNGGKKTRLNLIDETKPISDLIKTDYERLIKYGTYDKSVAVYYPKKQWILFSFNDPIYFPENRANRVFIFDLHTGEWYPLKNWLTSSFSIFDNDGTLLYGDSNDGYVYKADLDTKNDDAPKELSFDACESTSSWFLTVLNDTTTFIEGKASIQITNNFLNSYYSSVTKMGLINFGEWNDKSLVSPSKDYLSFKLKLSTVTGTVSLRVDFQYDVAMSSFTTYFSSVSLSTENLVSMGLTQNDWCDIRIKLSSFVIPNSWTNILTQEVPYSNNLTIYGVRFVVSGISTGTINIDDIRIVQGNKNIIEGYFLTKQFNLNSVTEKDWRQIILSREKSADSSFKIDIFTDFGYFANTKLIDKEIPKEIFVCGYKGRDGITRLKSSDFSVIDSTEMPNHNVYDYMNGVANHDYLVMFDKVKNRVLLLDRSSMSVVISSYGSLGSGTSNFNTVNQMAIVNNNVFLTDNYNDRIVQLVINNKKLLFVKTFGQLGTGNTNFFSPSGITADNTHLWMLDDGNSSIKKFTQNFDFVSSVKFDANTISEGVLQNDSDFLYSAYNKLINSAYYQDVILEKRNKGDMSLIQRIIIRPKDVTAISTYTLSGDIALLGRYIFIPFTKDLQGEGKYYVQKRLKDGFSLVDEYSTNGIQFSVIGDGYSYRPTVQSDKINLEAKNGVYLQLKYYDNEEDNNFRLFNYSFALDPKQYEEQKK